MVSRTPYTPDASRLRTVKRCMALWRFLEGRRTRPSLKALAEMLQVSTRTIRRDLWTLTECHFAVPPEREERDDLDVLEQRFAHDSNDRRTHV